MKKEELKVYIMATGIKKRCRKNERHMLKLGYYPLDTSKEVMRSHGLSTLNKEMKSCDAAIICFDFVRVSDNTGGFTIEEWAMFDPRHTKENLITSSQDFERYGKDASWRHS